LTRKTEVQTTKKETKMTTQEKLDIIAEVGLHLIAALSALRKLVTREEAAEMLLQLNQAKASVN
jgi:alkylhydroperoxidase/carboxymuconolactone decarboxylase family protein YurZ